MNDIPRPEIIEQIRKDHPKDSRVRLIKMVDPRPVPPNTEGSVIAVDGIGQIHMNYTPNKFSGF